MYARTKDLVSGSGIAGGGRLPHWGRATWRCHAPTGGETGIPVQDRAVNLLVSRGIPPGVVVGVVFRVDCCTLGGSGRGPRWVQASQGEGQNPQAGPRNPRTVPGNQQEVAHSTQGSGYRDSNCLEGGRQNGNLKDGDPASMVRSPGRVQAFKPVQLDFLQEFGFCLAPDVSRGAGGAREASLILDSTGEVAQCRDSLLHFVQAHCQIEDQVTQSWVPFALWPEQERTLKMVETYKQVIILKARQLGLTWLLVCYALWVMIFQPGSGVLLFSRRDDEAAELLDRLREVHYRLPPTLQQTITTNNQHELVFGELGSWARAFPTTKHSGRMYTASLAIVDEADFIQWLKRLLNAVRPTVDAGGRLVLLSTADKEKPNSAFKRLWHQAVRGDNHYQPIFLPWAARPGRDQGWYERMAADYEEDDLYQEYPATPEQALAARAAAKRFNPRWLAGCRGELVMASADEVAPGFRCCLPPRAEGRYLVAADPAEGNPGSNPSAASLFDQDNWQQVGVIHGRFEPDQFAAYLVSIAQAYNQAHILWERNNHGHAVEVALRFLDYTNIYTSPFDKKPGWLSNQKYKTLAVDQAAKALREGSLQLNDEATLGELAIFEAATLRAPQGDQDDLAMTVILAVAGLTWPSYQQYPGEGVSQIIVAPDPLTLLRF